MFECKGCQARAEEVEHLRAIITELQESTEKAQARVMELAAPGVNRRMLRGADIPKPGPLPRQGPVPPQMPGYEPRFEQGLELVDDAEEKSS